MSGYTIIWCYSPSISIIDSCMSSEYHSSIHPLSCMLNCSESNVTVHLSFSLVPQASSCTPLEETFIHDFTCGHANPSNITEPSLHEIKQKASATAWGAIRDSLRQVAVECSGMPFGQGCILCSAEAKYRCVDCAAWAYYCAQCFSDAHSKVGLLHTGEVWEVSKVHDMCSICHLFNLGRNV